MTTFRHILAMVLVTAFSISASAGDLATAVPAPGCDPCRKCRPVWPQESLRNEDQGTVVVALLIDVDGHAIATKIAKSSGHKLLDIATRDALVKCVYKPGTVNGKPVQDWMQMTFVWSLE
jgi:TonB family protein